MTTSEQLHGQGPGDIRELLVRIKNGDEEAARSFSAVTSRRSAWSSAASSLASSGRRFDSIDFLQSVWGSFFHKIQTESNDLNEEENLIAFLAWAARNKVIDEYRRAATQKQNIHREESIESRGDRETTLASGDAPSELAQAHETFDRLSRLLPEDRRVILELKAAGCSSTARSATGWA